MTYAFVWYAFLNFALFVINARTQNKGGPMMSPAVSRGFSGHWMAFYSAAPAILYSAPKVWEECSEWPCPNGHEVTPRTKFCDQCGQPVQYLLRHQNKL